MVIGLPVIVQGHRTNLCLEDVYWKGLREIAEERGDTLAHLITTIDASRQRATLPSAIRRFVLGCYHNRVELSRMVA